MKLRRYAALLLIFALLAGCKMVSPDPTPDSAVTPTTTPTAAPTAGVEVTPTPTPDQGPVTAWLAIGKDLTVLGMAWFLVSEPSMMPDYPGEGGYNYVQKDTTAEIVEALKDGRADIATLPTNLASVLYHETDGGIQLLSLCSYGGLYILEKGWDVYSIYDLAGKTVHAVGQGADPEYILRYLCRENGLEPAEVTVKWHDTADQAVAATAVGELCMLPALDAYAALQEDADLRQALDLSLEWEYVGGDGTPITGCVVARSEFARAYPEVVEDFLKKLEESVAYMTDPDNLDQAADHGAWCFIDPTVTREVLPKADLRFVTGEDMISAIQGYYQTLYQVDPASIGGSIPDGAFYYGQK